MKPQRIAPAPGQESVWDYPRPPRVEDSPHHIRIIFNNNVIADTTLAQRVLETSHPPVYYIPPQDIRMEFLGRAPGASYCEFKGQAIYYTVKVGDKEESAVAWAYPDPNAGFESIKNFIAFYPGRMDACYVDDELVRPQPGNFYGGWITANIVGPFKGEPGTMGW